MLNIDEDPKNRNWLKPSKSVDRDKEESFDAAAIKAPAMESFEDIQKKELAHLTGEIGTLGRRLVELGWSREQVVAYVKQLLTDPTNSASGDSTDSHTADRP